MPQSLNKEVLTFFPWRTALKRKRKRVAALAILNWANKRGSKKIYKLTRIGELSFQAELIWTVGVCIALDEIVQCLPVKQTGYDDVQINTHEIRPTVPMATADWPK